MKNIKQGSIVKGHFWPGPVEIKLLEEAGEYIRIVGATIVSGKHIDQIIPRNEFQKLSLHSEGALFSEEPWKTFLTLETIR